MLVTVSGDATYGEDAEFGSDEVYSNSDGTTTIKVNNLLPDELDSFEFNGEVTDYVVDDGYGYTVSVDGKTTTFENLTDGTFDYNGSGTPDGSEDNSGDSTDDGDELPKSLVVDGQTAGDVTTYTFTVTGEVVRDVEDSTSSDDGLTWSAIEDVADGGKVVGLVGDGVDVFQYSGEVTDFTVDGDAAVYMERND